MSKTPERAWVARVVIVAAYPDGEVKAIPVKTDGVKLIMFDHSSIVDRLSGLGVDLSEWNSGDWKNNPSVLIERVDGQVILYCKYTGHEKTGCNAAGPVVYPSGVPRSLPGAVVVEF
ncbi:MAG: hypothetical protein U0795_19990 [Pirellulales bacterium]